MDQEGVDRVALVTGSRGAIGGAIVAQLQRSHIRTWGLDRLPPDPSDPDALYIQADLGAGPMLPTFHIAESCLDYVFHVAGGALQSEVDLGGLLRDVTEIEKTLRDNFISALDVLHATIPLMRVGGSITLTSSINAMSDYGLPVYSASKAALHGLVNAFAPTLAERGIRLNVAVLGTVVHEGVQELHAQSPDHFEVLRLQTSEGVLLTPETVAEAIIKLGLDEVNTSGSIAIIDEGQLMSRGIA